MQPRQSSKEQPKDEKEVKSALTFRLFGIPSSSLVTKLGNMILRGEEQDVKTVLNEVKNDPALLDMIVTARDPLNTPVTGTLLQIAAMAGDVILVEKLAEAGGLSKERVAQELECVNSASAILENKERVDRYLSIMRTYMNKVLQEDVAYYCLLNHRNQGRALKELQAKCEKHRRVLDEMLNVERQKEVRFGLTFDPNILLVTNEMFKEPLTYQPILKRDVLWIHGVGTLQSKLSARDKQLIQHGTAYSINYFNDDSERTLGDLENLGIDFFIGYEKKRNGEGAGDPDGYESYYNGQWHRGKEIPGTDSVCASIHNLISNKKQRLEKLAPAPSEMCSCALM